MPELRVLGSPFPGEAVCRRGQAPSGASTHCLFCLPSGGRRDEAELTQQAVCAPSRVAGVRRCPPASASHRATLPRREVT